MSIELELMQYESELKYSKRGLVSICKRIVDTKEGNSIVNLLASKINSYLIAEYWDSKADYITAINMTNVSVVDIAEHILITGLKHKETVVNNVANEIGNLFIDWIDDVFIRVQIGSDLLVACEGLVYNLIKKGESIMFISVLNLSDEDKLNIAKFIHLPPMVSKPLPIHNNYGSGYYTIKDSVFMGGKEKVHGKQVRLDVINILNGIEFVLDTEVIKNIEQPKEMPTGIDLVNYIQFVTECVALHREYEDKSFYFNHKLDSRQRIYCQGYHLSYQATEFRKASISLAKFEEVEII